MGSIELMVMLVMILFNSIFAAYEIALAAVSVARLQMLAGENRSGAPAALFMKENVEASLAAIQLGITLFGAVAAATGGASAGEQIAPLYQRQFGLGAGWAEFLAVVTVVVPLTAVTILFGELVPKVFALRNKEWVCLTLSPWMRWFSFTVWPAVWLFEASVSAITDWGERHFRQATGQGKAESTEIQDLRATATLARTSRLIGTREEGIIHAAVRLTSRPVREIMLPASVISMLDANAPLTEALIASHLDMHTRFPVTRRQGDPQGIIGYANVKDIVAAMRLSPHEPTLPSITRPLSSFPETETISACLERLLRDSAHIALVRAPDGRVVGMVTLEDIVEELLGDIGDEYDRLPTHVMASGKAWVVGGGTPLARVTDTTELDLTTDLPSAGATTVSDWATGHLGRGARGGDEVRRPGLRLVVRKVRRQRVLEAQISALPPAEMAATARRLPQDG